MFFFACRPPYVRPRDFPEDAEDGVCITERWHVTYRNGDGDVTSRWQLIRTCEPLETPQEMYTTFRNLLRPFKENLKTLARAFSAPLLTCLSALYNTGQSVCVWERRGMGEREGTAIKTRRSAGMSCSHVQTAHQTAVYSISSILLQKGLTSSGL